MRAARLGRWVGAALAAGLVCAGAASAQDAQRQLDSRYPNYQPSYPDAAQVNGEQGDVVLKLRVADNGRVRGVQVMRSSGFVDLDNAAVAGVMSWRYVPSDSVSMVDNVKIAYRLPTAAAAAPATPH